MTEISVRMITAMAQIDPKDWDRCANPDDQPYDPFLSWDFLDALETSGCAVAETGWAPRHLIAEDDERRVLGVMPLYVKGHSYGEYVFDHAWADALERAGGAYYPKLLTAIPFTPATGRRVLSPDALVREALVKAGRHAVRELGLSSWHILFADAPTQTTLTEAGLPTALQLIAPPHRDDLVLQLAQRYESRSCCFDDWPAWPPLAESAKM